MQQFWAWGRQVRREPDGADVNVVEGGLFGPVRVAVMISELERSRAAGAIR
jgi:hypothetical protein